MVLIYHTITGFLIAFDTPFILRFFRSVFCFILYLMIRLHLMYFIIFCEFSLNCGCFSLLCIRKNDTASLFITPTLSFKVIFCFIGGT